MHYNFDKLWRRTTHKDGSKIYSDLVKLYSQKHRHYHTMSHIGDCIGEMHHCNISIENYDALLFALFFHDIIYNPKRKDNEEKSAELAYNLLIENDAKQSFAEKVKKIILATKHDKIPESLEEKLIIDFDLSVFANNERYYDILTDRIRKEYSFVPDIIFREERIKLLENFLKRKNIYQTEEFQEKYEEKARKNIKREIEILKDGKSNNI